MLLTRCTTAQQRWPAMVGQSLNRTFNSTRMLHQSGSAQAPFTVAPLTARKFVRVQGSDSVSFLQGLMTNDMRHFEHCGVMYTMFLKANGRVFCDTLMYKRPAVDTEPHDYLLECDASVAPRLEKHLKLYRLRKKVQVAMDETYRVWAAFKNEVATGEAEGPIKNSRLHVLKDPRLPRLGYRVLSQEEQSITEELLKSTFPDAVMSADKADPYTEFRYSLGIGEGEENLPDGKCFPLECNCDLLHGVSFHKGCYIGQELTARTYHTGVIRKRLMPLVFESAPKVSVDPEALRDAEIKNDEGTAVGKLRGLIGNHGIGLLRIEKILAGGKLTLNIPGETSAIPCRTSKPFWWPKELNTRA
ncbi:putative transferase CAF17 homolog, mitochondrial [Anopheles marshallii]|uniref:putative transferase CAF17 homolog, mitochondrial n=1 Tax=Anopheles marshallii TaxID=1521116 RepID=UPI00237B9F77|nr:putative transferase CAF17 homolog, mitochondrial [Anopheles marshallii]